MNPIRAYFANLSATVELALAEVKNGVTLIEAVAASEFEAELRALTTSEAEREDIRRAAIMVAQVGGTSSEVEPAFRELRSGKLRLSYSLYQLKRTIDSIADDNGATLPESS